jgi:quinol monooxygenase YgiN
MSISFGAAAAAALAALVFTGLLVHRCVRTPRLDLAALLCATVGLTASLAAQAIGYRQGFGATTFRGLYLGALLLAPMALAWALAEMTGKSMGARFAARLALGGLTMVAAVVLASDPLSTAAFGKAWPTATAHYQVIPRLILDAIGGVAGLTAVVAVGVAAARARRYPGWRELFLPVVATAVAALVTEGIRVRLPANSGYAGICLAAAGLAWFAGLRASKVRLDVLRLGGPVWNEDTGEFVRYNEDTGEFAPYRDDTGYGYGRADTGGYRADTGGYDAPGADPGYTGWFRDDTGSFSREGQDGDFSGWFRDDTGSMRRPGDSGGYGYGPADTDYGRSQDHLTNGHAVGYQTGDMLPAVQHQYPGQYPGVPGQYPGAPGQYPSGPGQYPGAQAQYPGAPGQYPPMPGQYPGVPGPQGDMDDTSRLYGQIAIFTLIDGRTDEFDRLAYHVVEQVKSREPDTLVYVLHGVPSAPQQRILYEVYRDETAFDGHARQPYIQQFEEQRKPYVLATNVIELGVRHAKFSPPPRPSRGQEAWRNGAR